MLRENCPKYLSVFSPNAGKYGPVIDGETDGLLKKIDRIYGVDVIRLPKLHTQKLNALGLSSIMKSIGGASFSTIEIRIALNQHQGK